MKYKKKKKVKKSEQNSMTCWKVSNDLKYVWLGSKKGIWSSKVWKISKFDKKYQPIDLRNAANLKQDKHKKAT